MMQLKQHGRLAFGLLLAALCIGSVFWYSLRQERNYRHLLTVKPGVLYRSGQMTPSGLERTLYELNICTLVNLRGKDYQPKANTTTWESRLCEKNFVKFVSISLGSPEFPERITPEQSLQTIEEAVRRFKEIIENPEEFPQPILVHCLAGAHRTGVMSAIYRIEYQGWSKERALTEMKELGYRNFTDPDPLRDFIVHWSPRSGNSPLQGTPASIQKITAPASPESATVPAATSPRTP